MTFDRLVAAMLRRLQRPLNRLYAARHPGPLARHLILMAAPLVRRMVPNDRWSLGVHAPYWMQAVEAPPLHPLPKPRRIFQLCAYRGQFTLELSLAALLAWRGHQVTIGYLPRLGSPIKPPLHDHPSAKSYLSSALARVGAASGGRVRVFDLTRYADVAAPIDRQLLENQARSDAMMRMGRETFAGAEREAGEALDHYREIGLRSQRIAHSFFAAHGGEFDLALIANGMTFEQAHFAHVARALGIEFVTYEKFAFRHVRVVTHGDGIFSFRDLTALWKRRVELGFLDPPFRAMALARSQELLNERRRASTRNWAWKYQFAPDQTDDASLAAAGLSPGEPYVLVCTNVPYDAGFLRLTTIFPSMREWLVETVRFLLENTDITVVVRVHPGEALHYGGRESSIDTLAATGLSSQPRLRVIGPTEKVNTYPLMERCRAGVVFSSTTGVEMAMLGRPVVVGSKIYYADLGFTQDSSDRAGYFATLAQAVAGDFNTAESRRIAADAQLYYYLLHFVLQQPYPYDKGEDLRRLPPHRLVRSSEASIYVKTLDLLATAPSEFPDALDRFFGVPSAIAREDACELARVTVNT